MFEPVLDMEKFQIDFWDGMSASNLQKKYKITPRQYRIIKRRLGNDRHHNYERKQTRVRKYVSKDIGETYITMKNTGQYIIRKNKIYYGQYDSLEIAKKIKQRLIEEEWDKNKLDGIRDEFNIPPIRSYVL